MDESANDASPLPDLFDSQDWESIGKHLVLTQQQLRIARLICLGYGNHDQARLLGVSPNTVRMHRKGLFERLNVHDRVGVPVRVVLAWRGKRVRRR